MKTIKHITSYPLIVPDDIELKEHEIELIKNISYKGRPITSWRKKSTLLNACFVYLVIKHNGGLTKNECSLPVHYFTHIPNPYTKNIIGVDSASQILKGLVDAGLLHCNNHWNRESKIPKKYKVSDKMKSFDKIREVNNKKNTQKYMNMKTVQDNELIVIQELISKYNTPFNRGRYSNAGINPMDNIKCSCCENELPSYMFSLSKTNKLNSKCRVCWTLEENPEDSMEICRKSLILFKQETPTQRSIKKLKEKVTLTL